MMNMDSSDTESVRNIYLYGLPEVGKKSIIHTIKKFITEIAKTLTKLNISYDQNDVQFSCLSHKQYLSLHQSRNTIQHQSYLILYCFDIADQSSFDHLLKLFKSPSFLGNHENVSSSSSSSSTTLTTNNKLNLLIGNKLDMEYWRQVNDYEVKTITELHAFKYIEVSSHTNMHMNILIDLLLPYIFSNISYTNQIVIESGRSFNDADVREYICNAITQAMTEVSVVSLSITTLDTNDDELFIGGVVVPPSRLQEERIESVVLPPPPPPLPSPQRILPPVDFEYEDGVGQKDYEEEKRKYKRSDDDDDDDDVDEGEEGEEEIQDLANTINIMHQMDEMKKKKEKKEKLSQFDKKKKSKKKMDMPPEREQQQQQQQQQEILPSKPSVLPLPPSSSSSSSVSLSLPPRPPPYIQQGGGAAATAAAHRLSTKPTSSASIPAPSAPSRQRKSSTSTIPVPPVPAGAAAAAAPLPPSSYDDDDVPMFLLSDMTEPSAAQSESAVYIPPSSIDDELLIMPLPAPLAPPPSIVQLDDRMEEEQEEAQPVEDMGIDMDEDEDEDEYRLSEILDEEEKEEEKEEVVAKIEEEKHIDIEDGRMKLDVIGDDDKLQQLQQRLRLDMLIDEIDHQQYKLHRLEPLEDQSIQLSSQDQLESNQYFKKQAKRIKQPILYCIKTTGSILTSCGYGCIYGLLFLPVVCYNGTKSMITKLTKGNKLFDNVLGDNENAFQTLAKFMIILKGSNNMKNSHNIIKNHHHHHHHHQCVETCLIFFSNCFYYCNRLMIIPFFESISFIIVLISTVVLILPSFFTILILRTTTVEKESKAFGIRQEVIRHEKPEQSFIRWCRIVIRSLPMTFYILIVPYLMVYHLFPYYKQKYISSSPSISAGTTSNDDVEMYSNTITGYLLGYFIIIIILQLLGTVRAYYSWNDDDDDDDGGVNKQKQNKHNANHHSKAPSLFTMDEKAVINHRFLKNKMFLTNSATTTTTSTTTNDNASTTSANVTQRNDAATTSMKGNKSSHSQNLDHSKSRSTTDIDVDEPSSTSTTLPLAPAVTVTPAVVSKRQPSVIPPTTNNNSNNYNNQKAKNIPSFRPTPIPEAPNSFSLYKVGNYVVLGSLTLEFIQMAFFPLQNNPYATTNSSTSTSNTSSSNNSNIPTLSPTLTSSTTLSLSSAYYFGETIFNYLYITSISPLFQTITSWVTILCVFLLLLLFAYQFLVELQVYGYLMKRVEDKDKAKDSFFFSFTGSVIYGHGKPRNISSNLRLAIGVLTDGLFLIITYNLLAIVSCDYDVNNNNSNSSSSSSSTFSPVLFSNSDMKCWESEHSLLAALALSCYAFYVPLSIMIAPMLMEIPSTSTDNTIAIEDTMNSHPDDYKKEDEEDHDHKHENPKTRAKNQGSGRGREEENHGEVTYMKLYLMIINVVKSIMLLVTTMGPTTVLKTVISSTLSSVVLGIVTVIWFYISSHKNDKKRRREEEVLRITTMTGGVGNGSGSSGVNKRMKAIGNIQPCNKAFINTWKAASYTAAVSSAIIIIIAHYLGDEVFPLTYLLPVLILTWGALVMIFIYSYYRWYQQNNSHFEEVKELISYPFIWRDYKDEAVLRHHQNHNMILIKNNNNNKNNDNHIDDNTFAYVTILQQHPHLNHIPGYTKSPWFDREYYSRVNKINSDINNRRMMDNIYSKNKNTTTNNNDNDDDSIMINNMKIKSSNATLPLPKPLAPLRALQMSDADRGTNITTVLELENGNSLGYSSSSSSIKNPLNASSDIMLHPTQDIVNSQSSPSQSAALTLAEAAVRSERESVAWCVGQYVGTQHLRDRNLGVRRNTRGHYK